jgi:hypothetical protein
MDTEEPVGANWRAFSCPMLLLSITQKLRMALGANNFGGLTTQRTVSYVEFLNRTLPVGLHKFEAWKPLTGFGRTVSQPMSSTVLQINFIPKRMLTIAEGARHCGRSLTRFKIECPVQPVRFANGDVRYDVQDLDIWLTSLKAGTGDYEIDTIVSKLGV